ncbi:hypothetical protein V1292_005108 [Bradyrhizobium sp. AZCC 1719]
MMRFVNLIISAAVALFWTSQTHAAIQNFDISTLAGFTTNGVAGTGGNGIVFMSPVYSVAPNSTVDFGTAFLYPDEIDGRGGCYFSNICYSQYAFRFDFLNRPEDGLTNAPFESDGIFSFVFCDNGICPPAEIRLSFNIPADIHAIQFLFQGSELAIAAPVPEPSTWAMLLIGFASLGFAAYRRSELV